MKNLHDQKSREYSGQNSEKILIVDIDHQWIPGCQSSGPGLIAKYQGMDLRVFFQIEALHLNTYLHVISRCTVVMKNEILLPRKKIY